MNLDEKETAEQETQVDIDLEAAQAEISSELFGQGDDGETVDPPEGEGEASGEVKGADADVQPSPQPAEEKPAAPVEGETSEEVQAIGAPKTWTKEALAKWATIDPVVQQEIQKREADFLSGIQGYKAAAEIGQAYDNVVEPYRPMLAAENLDPVVLFQSFAANHYLLSRGSEAQKIELATALFDGYKIPLAPFLEHLASRGELKPANPELDALRKEVQDLRSGFSARQSAEQTALQTRLRTEIDEFAADPAHPYFDEVANDIQRLFQAGLAESLPQAYEMAIYANPTTRQKEIERLTADKLTSAEAETTERKNKVQRSKAEQVLSTPKTRDGTVPTGSIDDTLAETMARIEARA